MDHMEEPSSEHTQGASFMERDVASAQSHTSVLQNSTGIISTTNSCEKAEEALVQVLKVFSSNKHDGPDHGMANEKDNAVVALGGAMQRLQHELTMLGQVCMKPNYKNWP
jgi:hypothetical protein